jgi:hypothetical protein
MKKRTKSILLGIADGFLPGVFSSIKKSNEGQIEVNKTRLMTSILSYVVLVLTIRGKISIDKAVEIIKILFNVQ